ncbi:MAG: hypothetical protein ACP5P2_00495 [Candidatus Micrarchaeia archaeon]
MPLEEIRNRIIEEAKKKRQAILEEAKKESEAIIREAQEKAKKREEEAKKLAKEKVEEMLNEYMAEHEVERHNAELLAKEDASRRALKSVEGEMKREIEKNYSKILASAKKRIEEEGLGFELYAEKKYAPMLKKLGYLSKECDKGIFAKSADGSISIDLTPEKIINEHIEEAKGMIIRALFREEKREKEEPYHKHAKKGKTAKPKKRVKR